MKHKTRKYAEGLVRLLLESKKEGADKALAESFLKLLERNGDLKKAREAVVLAERLWFKKTGKRKITIESARKIEKRALVHALSRNGDFVRERMNPGLIAGVRITVNGEQQLEVSLRKRIENMFQYEKKI